MRSDEQPDVLHTRLARSNWASAPVARLHYDQEDDGLVAELVAADPITAVQVGAQLLVEFDGTDSGARPTTVYLTGFRSHPDTADAAQARVVVGERLWSAAVRLAAEGGGECEIWIDDSDARARQIHWAGLLDRLGALGGRVETLVPERRPTRIIGVEVVPGLVTAVLTDGGTTILGQASVPLDGNGPPDVVTGVERAISALENDHADMGVDRCPLGIQLGGPVDAGSGTVLFYDKPRPNSSDQPWSDEPLGDMLAGRTGRRVVVSNDAHALAVHEIETATRDDDRTVALLLVRQGVGAKLIRAGEVQGFPMEIGVFMPDASLGKEEAKGATIEAGSGVRAIVHAVSDVTGVVHDSIDDAATTADDDETAADQFWWAGAHLSRAVAAVQAIVDPDEWVVYAPGCLLDTSRPAGRYFVDGLDRAPELLTYRGLGPVGHTRLQPADGVVGGLAAALVVTRRARGIVDSASERASEVRPIVRGGRRVHGRT